MKSLNSTLDFLRSTYINPSYINLPDEVDYYSEEHELIQAYYAYFLQKIGKKFNDIHLLQGDSGAVTLLHKHFFPWGGLPYPREHAELGVILSKLNDEALYEKASKMVPFQQAILDHKNNPLFAVFRQETGCKYQALQASKDAFFSNFQMIQKVSFSFKDDSLGILSLKDVNKTIFCTASGCKSGMLIYLVQDVGVINCGPQFFPLGDCEGFGIAGRPLQLSFEEKNNFIQMEYCTRLAAPHPRNTGIHGLKDSGFSGMWIQAKIVIKENKIQIEGELKGSQSINGLVFSFFTKGHSCYVSGTHKLSPKSLDRYIGPCSSLEMRGSLAQCTIFADYGIAKMEVIPLVGGDDFWGADFLIAYQFKDSKFSFSIESN